MRSTYTKAFAIFCIFAAIVAAAAFLDLKHAGGLVKSAFLNAPRPIIYGVRAIARPVESFFSSLYNLRKIAQQNTQLKAQVYQLQQQLVLLNEYQRENQDLKNELGFVSSTSQAYVPCSVIAQNPLGLSDTLITNCGSNVGIQQGQGVVSQGYLIGKVVYVDSDSSTVMLVTSSQFTTDARLSGSGATGVIEGSYGSGIILDQLSQSDTVSKGDLVVTAGISAVIPKNILIGQVGDVLSSPNDPFKKTTVLTPIDLNNLEFVFMAK